MDNITITQTLLQLINYISTIILIIAGVIFLTPFGKNIVNKLVDSYLQSKLENEKFDLRIKEISKSSVQDLIKSNISRNCEIVFQKRLQAAENILLRRHQLQPYINLSYLIGQYYRQEISLDDLKNSIENLTSEIDLERDTKVGGFKQNDTMDLYLSDRTISAFTIYRQIIFSAAYFARNIYSQTTKDHKSLTKPLKQQIQYHIKNYYNQSIEIDNIFSFIAIFHEEIMFSLQKELPELGITSDNAIKYMNKLLEDNKPKTKSP